jgi:hypothetical protein
MWLLRGTSPPQVTTTQRLNEVPGTCGRHLWPPITASWTNRSVGAALAGRIIPRWFGKPSGPSSIGHEKIDRQRPPSWIGPPRGGSSSSFRRKVEPDRCGEPQKDRERWKRAGEGCKRSGGRPKRSGGRDERAGRFRERPGGHPKRPGRLCQRSGGVLAAPFFGLVGPVGRLAGPFIASAGPFGSSAAPFTAFAGPFRERNGFFAPAGPWCRQKLGANRAGVSQWRRK